MAVVEKPIDDRIKLTSATDYPEYDPSVSHTIWVDVNLTAPIFEDDDNKRALVDIVAVIDRSGSMAGAKLNLVKETLEFVVSQLTTKDRLCLIVYDDKIDEVFPLTYVNPENKTDIMNKIKSVQTRGTTNLCGGLLKGMQVVMKRTGVKADVASVLLLTDGLANAGISKKEGIIQAMKNPFSGINSQQASFNPSVLAMNNANISSYPQTQILMQQQQQPPPPPPQQQQMPMVLSNTNNNDEIPMEIPESEPPNSDNANFDGTVYTFGFGANHNAELLKEISDAQNGVYYFIDTAEKVPESFANCLGGLLSTIGQNISFKAEMKNGAVIKQVIAKNTAKYNENKTEAEVALGDLQSEEQRDVLLELDVPVSSEEDPNKQYGNFTINYFNVITSSMQTEQCVLKVERTNTGKPRQINPVIEKQKMRIETISVIQQAQLKAKQGQFTEGRQLLDACKAKVETANINEDSAYSAMMGDIDDCLVGVKDQFAYSGYGQQRMMNAMQSNMQQRQNWSATPNTPMQQVGYCTAAKTKMMNMAPKK